MIKHTLPDSEKTVEALLREIVKKEGGLYIKLTRISGIPDRLILLPKGRVRFVEVKSKGKNPTPLQARLLKVLSGLGFPCYVLRGGDDFFKLTEIIEGI